uniref:Uncharacterized protein n=1 Tax=Panagrolaimus sp. ES5 TaxID=591445 RepID=A0AC34GKK1_9BILA
EMKRDEIEDLVLHDFEVLSLQDQGEAAAESGNV